MKKNLTRFSKKLPSRPQELIQVMRNARYTLTLALFGQSWTIEFYFFIIIIIIFNLLLNLWNLFLIPQAFLSLILVVPQTFLFNKIETILFMSGKFYVNSPNNLGWKLLFMENDHLRLMLRISLKKSLNYKCAICLLNKKNNMILLKIF